MAQEPRSHSAPAPSRGAECRPQPCSRITGWVSWTALGAAWLFYPRNKPLNASRSSDQGKQWFCKRRALSNPYVPWQGPLSRTGSAVWQSPSPQRTAGSAELPVGKSGVLEPCDQIRRHWSLPQDCFLLLHVFRFDVRPCLCAVARFWASHQRTSEGCVPF